MFHRGGNFPLLIINNMIPINASPIIAAGVSTLGNLLGGQLSASEQYKYQSKLAEQQFGYNKELLQLQQDYNNPKNQLAMYRAAGINPYAALGNNTSVSLPSVGQGSASAPNFGNLGTDAVNAYAQGNLMQSDKDLRVAQAQQAVSQAQMFEQSRLKLAEDTKNQRIQNHILETTANDHIKLARAEVNLAWAQVGQHETQAALNELLAIAQKTTNDALPKQIQMSLAESASRIQLQYLQGQLSKAQASAALAAAYKSECEAIGVKVDNRIKGALEFDYIENFVKQNDKLREEIERLSKENNWIELRNLLESINSGFQIGEKASSLGLRTAFMFSR